MSKGKFIRRKVKLCRPCAEKLKERGEITIANSCKDKTECAYCQRQRYVYDCEVPESAISNFLTTEEVGQKLGVSKRNVCRLLGRCELNGMKLGELWAVSPKDLEDYIDQTS